MTEIEDTLNNVAKLLGMVQGDIALTRETKRGLTKRTVSKWRDKTDVALRLLEKLEAKL